MRIDMKKTEQEKQYKKLYDEWMKAEKETLDGYVNYHFSKVKALKLRAELLELKNNIFIERYGL